MSAYNTTLEDKEGNEVYPKTLASNVYDGQVRMDQKVDGIRNDLGTPSSASGITGSDAFTKINNVNTNLGSPSSAAAVTGADAFSKISSLNSDLANKIDVGSALAVFGYRQTQNLDANDLTSGLYIIRPSYVSNMPSELAGATSYTMLLGTGQSDEAVQILLNSAQSYLWFRRRYGSWSAWTKIAFS